MREIVTRIMGPIMRKYGRRVLGKPSAPSKFALYTSALINRLPGNRFPILTCQGPLDGYKMKVDWHGQRGFVYGTWEPDVVAAFRAAVQPGQVALDIGAAVGFYTLLLAKLVGPKGRVYSFEPMAESRAVLEENVRLNGLAHVTVTPKAVMDYSGELELHVNNDGNVLHAHLEYAEGVNGVRFVSVPCLSIDDFWEDKGMPVHFMKIDVEGAEAKVLQGARRVIEACRPNLLIELHYFDRIEGEHPALQILRDWGYAIKPIDKGKLTEHILCVPARSEVFA